MQRDAYVAKKEKEKETRMEHQKKTKSEKNSGFTYIELIVVVGVITLLTGITISGLSGSRARLDIFKDQASVINAFLRARGLALNTFAPIGFNPTTEKLCGFGILVDYNDEGGDGVSGNEIIIYQDKIRKADITQTQDCDTDATMNPLLLGQRQYSGPAEKFETYTLSNDVRLMSNSSFGVTRELREIFFLPPKPTITLTTIAGGAPAPRGVEPPERAEGFVVLSNQTVTVSMGINRRGAVSYTYE
ncbi:MAG: hypothetical protein COU08_03830 [Candidatus Harrisonbacteria bacterium CG10_big_fil_rev_8_21_14_0_10_42_17]|uniref:Prepilin-type N-terminal cleavage/methylation domain-containing protein n=1 Tax=Candidatus Harrisonbacteria bacterium CG10_big_fil_rev_8_21_14_0_10_42_17 TaxID=1974584 RepID=A0A2M6WHB7_9BACT|nr:MAG: hypothetical protein COU08_03830 [Candidatus Harrisonbacteria bacterium CG10_big_fil_rev_8_21_14_0_10_42_17]